jgi:hypothetical protein
MIHGTITIDGGRAVQLASYLDAKTDEAAHDAEYRWIKSLRHARVDGASFRDRFTFRGDSLWWFTEIYLHKQQAILDLHRVILATRALIDRERPRVMEVTEGSLVVRDLVPQVAAHRHLATNARRIPSREWSARLARIDWRARMLALAARASRLKSGSERPSVRPAIAAFVHRAFWQAGRDDGSAESYIGPVLAALERAASPGEIGYVGIGPSSNFRVRRWWHPLAPITGGPSVTPIERFAPWTALRESHGVWKARRRHFEVMSGSDDLRAASMIDGVDCWPIVHEQLAGVSWLQWPWSARAMDEAAAALVALQPRTALTYAEAGGWGRALILEARRCGIPSIGLQHGFIYHRWLNYLHEPDEMGSGPGGDAGFPAPTLTLLFDNYAARHLQAHGRFPSHAVRVTGSPKLDALMTSLGALTPEQVSATRREVGAPDEDAIVLLTTKEAQVRSVLPALAAAVASIPGARLVIKPHPGESETAYDEAVRANGRVRVVASTAPLAPLLGAARAVVTVNSTVALDAAVLGIPALVIGLPNNLSPFVDAGALAGAGSTGEIGPQLERILYDEGFRLQLERAREAFLDRYAMRSTGVAAVRSAEAILELART